MKKLKLIRLTTASLSLNYLLSNQLSYINQFFDVLCISSQGKDLEIVKHREGVKIKAIQMEREIAFIKDLVSLGKLLLLFIKQRPAIVHSNTPKASLLSMIAARLTGVPVRIYTVTGLRLETQTGFKRSLLINMERLACACATHIVAESKGVKHLLQKFVIAKKNIYIIANGTLNGIDEEYWCKQKVSLHDKEKLYKSLSLSDENPIVLFVGRLVVDKGVNELVEAFINLYKEDSTLRLLLVGATEKHGNSLSHKTLDIISQHPGIISTGFQKDVRLFMSISHLLVLPSYREGFPNVVLQAGAMELPVVSTNVNGAVEVIDGKNGTIVKKKIVSDLEKAIADIVYKKKSIDEKYCRQVIIDKYSQQKLFPEVLNFYHIALSEAKVKDF